MVWRAGRFEMVFDSVLMVFRWFGEQGGLIKFLVVLDSEFSVVGVLRVLNVVPWYNYLVF